LSSSFPCLRVGIISNGNGLAYADNNNNVNTGLRHQQLQYNPDIYVKLVIKDW